MKTMCIGMSLAAVFVLTCLAIDLARSAEIPVPSETIRNYSDHFYARRWAKLCKGGGRYVAMAEAHELGKPNPCGH